MLLRGSALALLSTALVFAADPAFDVASVKPSKPDAQPYNNIPLGPGDVYVPNGGLFQASALPLVTYIFFAYKFIGNQGQLLIPQLPAWVMSEKFDIQARASGNPSKDDIRAMMRSLLADRFKLALHYETKDIPVFAWVLVKPGKLGPKIAPHTEDPPCEVKQSSTPAPGGLALTRGLPVLCNGIFGMPATTPGNTGLAARDVALDFVADSLSAGSNLGRPMVNKTGMNGKFDLSLEWTPEKNGNIAAPGPDSKPSETAGTTLQEALRDQWGIRLQADKAAMKVVVFDHVEHPTEN